jgi:hypothetical protein
MNDAMQRLHHHAFLVEQTGPQTGSILPPAPFPCSQFVAKPADGGEQGWTVADFSPRPKLATVYGLGRRWTVVDRLARHIGNVVPRKGLRVRVPCPPLSGTLDATKSCGVFLFAPTASKQPRFGPICSQNVANLALLGFADVGGRPLDVRGRRELPIPLTVRDFSGRSWNTETSYSGVGDTHLESIGYDVPWGAYAQLRESPSGHYVAVTAMHSNGYNFTQVERTATVDGVAITERYQYAYALSDGDSVLTSVTLSRRQGQRRLAERPQGDLHVLRGERPIRRPV